MYLKCDFTGCNGAAKIGRNELLVVTEEHIGHPTQEKEIQRLTALEKCSKRAADDVITPLRSIFDEEVRQD